MPWAQLLRAYPEAPRGARVQIEDDQGGDMVAVSFGGNVFLAAREYLITFGAPTRPGPTTTTRPERSVSVASSQSSGIEPPLHTAFPRRIRLPFPRRARLPEESTGQVLTSEIDSLGHTLERFILPEPVDGIRYRRYEGHIVSVLAQGGAHALVEFNGGQRTWVAVGSLEEPSEPRRSALDRLLEDE